MTSNPFKVDTPQPIVALCGPRNGYLMIAPSQEITAYQQLSIEVLLAAQAWASQLEALGSPRSYWITLSEVTRHLHIHIYPRWPEDTTSGTALFDARNNEAQPLWRTDVKHALQQWASTFQVEILDPESHLTQPKA